MSGHLALESRNERRQGFTLVELLVTVVVIGILASIVLGALQVARETARIAKTRTTIAKIDKVIAEQYESYRVRRVPVDSSWDPKAASVAKVNLLRDLMRMEMPDRWSDVTGGPLLYPRTPSRTLAFQAVYARAVAATNAATVENYGAAKLLYLIVMAGPGRDFHWQETEVGSPDADGLRVFVDGWGRPIRFIRWPAGFLPKYEGQTDIQLDDTTADTFDPQRRCPGYYTYPLVYSAGPDGLFDINIGKNSDESTYAYKLDSSTPKNLDPCQIDGQGKLIGLPLDSKGPNGEASNGRLDHYDNITNHRIQGNK